MKLVHLSVGPVFQFRTMMIGDSCFLVYCFQILLIIASVIGIIVYRLSVFIVFSAKLPNSFNVTDPIQKYLTPQTATSITASLISFIIIMILNIIYEKVAIMITNFGKFLP